MLLKIAFQLANLDSHLFSLRTEKPHESEIEKNIEDSSALKSNEKSRRYKLVGQILAPVGAIATTVYWLAIEHGNEIYSTTGLNSDLYKTLGPCDKALYHLVSVNSPKIGPVPVVTIGSFVLLFLTVFGAECYLYGKWKEWKNKQE